jgi:hypothetical protein
MSGEPYRRASSSYALGQLARALENAGERSERARKWREVLAGMAGGWLRVGTRTPVEGTPAWVTLEVAHGGFATGRYVAETKDAKEANLGYLTDEGALEALRHGRYRVTVPEEAALAVVTVLLDKGHVESALAVVEEVRPWLHRLRLAPRWEERPAPSGTAVRLRTVGEVSKDLRAVSVPRQIAAMRETLGVWNPLYDRLITLWCQTVSGELPRLEDGRVVGGWPGKVWPAGWTEERSRWLADVEKAGTPAGRRGHRKSNFARLHTALIDVDDLTARDVGWIRRALANTLTKHGEPGAERRESLRAVQAATVVRRTFASYAAELADRLRPYPADGGLAAVDPVADGIPKHLVAKAARALEAPAEELVRRGVITSGEVLAMVLPQLTARLLAAGFDDPTTAGLYEQTYTAFRRRRGLLLLNLEGQVRFEELPWVAALAPLRTTEPTATAYQALRETALLTLTAFPQDPVPNPLLTELKALAGAAEVTLPFVEEIAADIFTGTFGPKWRDAARFASTAMAGTVYGRYYDLPAPSYWDQGVDAKRWGRTVASDFADLCHARAMEAGDDGDYVRRNGMVVEQSQILTTHNLVPLVHGLDLVDQVRAHAPELARRTFDRVLHDRTSVLKLGHAWRQGVFLLSLCDEREQAVQVDRMRTGANDRLRPYVEGLASAVAGNTVTGGRFLGWGR